MNCKQGDLAIVVRSNAGNEGRIVRCIEPVPAGYEHSPGRFFNASIGILWRIDSNLTAFTKNMQPLPGVPYAYDAWLRPIRDQPGQDETLSWANKPLEYVR